MNNDENTVTYPLNLELLTMFGLTDKRQFEVTFTTTWGRTETITDNLTGCLAYILPSDTIESIEAI